MIASLTEPKGILLSLLERLNALAVTEGFSQLTDEAEDLLRKLAVDRFEIVVMGQFKRGKSSLINALIGEEVLPIGSVPLTSITTMVRHGKRPRAIVRFHKKSPRTVEIAQLPFFITEKGNPKNEKGVTRVEVETPGPVLAEGDVLVDTPGVGSVHAHNTQTAYQTLPRADAVLYVLSVDPPVGEDDLRFLVSIRSRVSKIFFVLNKKDYLSPKDFDENRAFTEQVLKQALQVESVSVFPVSSRWALEDNPERAPQSGVNELRNALQKFLREGKGKRVLERTVQRGEEAARTGLLMLEMEHRAYLKGSVDLENQAWLLSSAINNVFMEGALAKRRLKMAFAVYKKSVSRTVRNFCRAASRRVTDEAARSAAGSAHVAVGEMRERLAKFLVARVRETLQTFFEEKRVWMVHGFAKFRQDYEGRLFHQLDIVWKKASELFGPLPAVETGVPAEPLLPGVFVEPIAAFLPLNLTKSITRSSPAAEKILRGKVEALLWKAAREVMDEFLAAREADLKESSTALERLSRQAQELADRAVKVVVQRQISKESDVAAKLAQLRSRLVAAESLVNEFFSFRQSLSAGPTLSRPI